MANSGRVWLGTIHAGDVGFDLSVSDGHTRRIRALARAQFPALAELPIERAWAGLRPMPPDGLPILGGIPGWPVLAATGHFRNGILLAPWTAREVARLAFAQGGGEIPELSPKRFLNGS